MPLLITSQARLRDVNHKEQWPHAPSVRTESAKVGGYEVFPWFSKGRRMNTV